MLNLWEESIQMNHATRFINVYARQSKSVFFNVHLVSKSPTEFSPHISAFMELCSNANLPCLVNQAHEVILCEDSSDK